MITKTIAWITLACFVATLSGCYTTEQIPRDQIPTKEKVVITEAVTYKGEHYKFKYDVGGVGRDSMLVGTLEDGRMVGIPLSEIQSVYIRTTDVPLTILAVIGTMAFVAGVAALIFVLLKESCPFVYSYDGQQYVFDGEPYGGAICDALERTDWCKLEHLKPVDGEYRLLLTNEVNETQYTDEFKLWAVDHQPGTAVLPDGEGNLYCVRTPLPVTRATDARGNDITRWVRDNDKLFWTSDLRSKDPGSVSDRRDTISLRFPKPKGAARAKLVVNGSTTLWGSQMLKKMTELRGQEVPRWYESLKDPANQMLLEGWGMREELYKLQVKVAGPTGWVTRGILWGGGPFISEDRVVPLDLKQIEGDTLQILLAPPTGFWQLNSFAIDYSEEATPEYLEIAGSSMIGHDGADLGALLRATDKRYYVMPETGQKATLVFPAPPVKAGCVRTLFAKVSGYYDIRAKAEGAPMAEILERIANEPGYPVSFALEEYAKWKSELMRAAHMTGEKAE